MNQLVLNKDLCFTRMKPGKHFPLFGRQCTPLELLPHSLSIFRSRSTSARKLNSADLPQVEPSAGTVGPRRDLGYPIRAPVGVCEICPSEAGPIWT